MAEGEEGGEEARRGTGVANEEFGALRGDVPAEAGDGHFGIGFIELDVEAEGLQGSGKVTRVVGEEGVGQTRGSVRERGDQQGAVGKGLGAGDADGGHGDEGVAS